MNNGPSRGLRLRFGQLWSLDSWRRETDFVNRCNGTPGCRNKDIFAWSSRFYWSCRGPELQQEVTELGLAPHCSAVGWRCIRKASKDGDTKNRFQEQRRFKCKADSSRFLHNHKTTRMLIIPNGFDWGLNAIDSIPCWRVKTMLYWKLCSVDLHFRVPSVHVVCLSRFGLADPLFLTLMRLLQSSRQILLTRVPARNTWKVVAGGTILIVSRSLSWCDLPQMMWPWWQQLSI